MGRFGRKCQPLASRLASRRSASFLYQTVRSVENRANRHTREATAYEIRCLTDGVPWAARKYGWPTVGSIAARGPPLDPVGQTALRFDPASLVGCRMAAVCWSRAVVRVWVARKSDEE